MSGILSQMESEGFIRDLSVSKDNRFVKISLKQPESIKSEFDQLFSPKSHDDALENAPYVCQLVHRPDAMQLTAYVRLKDMPRMHIKASPFTPKKINGKEYTVLDLVHLLQDLEKEGIVSQLEIAHEESPDKIPEITFRYKNAAVQECFAKEGNLLEAYVWYEARNTKQFEELAPSFYFRWNTVNSQNESQLEGEAQETNVWNELDLIAVRNGTLSTLVISCKMADYNKDHLYELKSLSDMLGENSKAVIIYSPNKNTEKMNTEQEGKTNKEQKETVRTKTRSVINRAKEMNIHLIDSDTLSIPGALGTRLVQIADGQITP